MSRILLLYKNAFGGLSQAAWMLALVMFINRAGAMVLPFLSVYLTENLSFTIKQVGIVMSLFGLGSMGGAFLGGWLTDRVGHFKVQVASLITSGSLFFVLLQMKQFTSFAACIFILSLVAECLRPANSSSVVYYAKPENVTRAFSLNRMAMNLGFSIGPALGGLLASLSYRWLFMADGFSCIAAGIFFYFYFRRQRGRTAAHTVAATAAPSRSPYRDPLFLTFAVLCCLFAIIFFQFFTTLPLYYRQVYQLSELQIGSLLALNGVLVFSIEMIVVYLAGQRFKPEHLITLGTILVGLSFIILNLFQGAFILYTAMIILSIAEVFAMPFMATIAVHRSSESNRGAYMGLFTLSYSLAHVIGPYLGTSIISRASFSTLWWTLGLIAVFTALGFYLLVPKLHKQE